MTITDVRATFASAEVRDAGFWLILVSIQHSRVPTYDLAKNSDSGLDQRYQLHRRRAASESVR
jgi:hypothetical protein